MRIAVWRRAGARCSMWLGLLVACVAATAYAGRVTYSYDEAARLRSAQYNCGAATAYTLDAAGNRSSVQATPDAVGGALQFGAATYSVAETNATLSIPVTRACSSTGAVSVSYTFGGTAVRPTDYTVSGTLSWAAGDSATKTLTLTTVDNAVYSGDKTIILTLSAPTGGAGLAPPSKTTITIVENELPPVPGAVQFTAATLSVGEGTANAQLTITRPGASGAVLAASIVCTPSNGTATGGSDFTAGARTITWAANDASNKTCSIPITDDSTYEGNETFTATLSNPTGGMTLGAPLALTVTIIENDTVSLSIANATVNEGAGNVTLTVTKNGASALTHTVNYATADGTATAGFDYTPRSGTLTFAPADATKTIVVPILSDSVFEANRSFSVTLSAPTNGATLSAASATISIEDDDQRPLFVINNVTVNENAGSATLTVSRLGFSASAHSVNYASANGSAAAGSDYTAVANTLTFTPLVDSATITVPLLDDTVYEGNETFTINLSSPTNGAGISTPSATVTIQENDAAPSLTIGDVTVNEYAGTATFYVTKTGSSSLTHSVNYATADGTATTSDYTPVSGSLTFAPAEYTKTIAVAINNDTLQEANESFRVTLSSATNGAVVGGVGYGFGTILDDDAPAGPAVPANLSVTFRQHGPDTFRYTASWSASAGATSYELTGIGSTGASTTTSWFEESVDGSTTYSVRACNASGCSGWSPPVFARSE